jgi:hypothetical protein
MSLCWGKFDSVAAAVLHDHSDWEEDMRSTEAGDGIALYDVTDITPDVIVASVLTIQNYCYDERRESMLESLAEGNEWHAGWYVLSWDSCGFVSAQHFATKEEALTALDAWEQEQKACPECGNYVDEVEEHKCTGPVS